MERQLTNFFRKRRLEKNLRLSAVARLVGYRNINRGCNRLVKFEREGIIRDDLLIKLAAVLDIGEDTVAKLQEEDHRKFVADWNLWANEPIRPYIVTRLIPGFYHRSDVPKELPTLAEAELYAAAHARRLRCKVWLIWTRRLTIRFDETGARTSAMELAPGDPACPTMRIGKKQFAFNLFDIKRPLPPPH